MKRCVTNFKITHLWQTNSFYFFLLPPEKFLFILGDIIRRFIITKGGCLIYCDTNFKEHDNLYYSDLYVLPLLFSSNKISK